MGVFMVSRSGAALVSWIPEMLVSYRLAPTMATLWYLVQMTDAGSVPCSATNSSNDGSQAGPFFVAWRRSSRRGSAEGPLSVRGPARRGRSHGSVIERRSSSTRPPAANASAQRYATFK